MVFSSPTFLFLFLPLFLVGYYIFPPRVRPLWILGGSWLFYGWWRLDFLLLLIFSSFGAAVIGRRIHLEESEQRRRRWTVGGVTVALMVLGYFKYFNFGVDVVSSILRGLGHRGIDAWSVVLPVGISFYIFQIISYLVDVYRRTAPVGRSYVDVMAYISLFPQLIAGPIVRYSDIADQLVTRTHSWQRFDRGTRRFMIGLARKVLIADAIAPIVDVAFSTGNPGFILSWLGLVAYALQIYFDFAAYSDMAIGLGEMMGFSFPENFNTPYHSTSITEFWRRWHMTLSRWLRDYLYIPLGGSRRGTGRTRVNLFLVMVLGGLWHGAAGTFIMWGAWHGFWLVVERGASLGASRIRTLFIVLAGWVLFRATSLAEAIRYGGALVGLDGIAIPLDALWQLPVSGLGMLVLASLITLWEPRFMGMSGKSCAVSFWMRWRRGIVPRAVVPGCLFLLSVLRLLASSYSPFLYFQF